ncbi:MAG: hypothetical protein AVDCRST_MAG49-3403 [uncultured Thermomicrobiales bacterium]|uniref:DinB-like domain-containing protein n=1 Tax=uncultured Thermomicrobiales bacterium TaxID=1645740 RepID=A0A6J4V9A5_9BACT|nr:MAG: hypothetical protein AVDCRST_MAG49-3403 [uncultured Thermomicrobiales bacterium]
MDAAERRALIDRYADGPRVIDEALARITPAELDAREAPGEWSPREVIHHLADSEMTSAIRLRLLLASDEPLIAGYDQEAFARCLHYDRPIDTAREAFRAARATTSELLDRITDADWARAGTHTESGRYGAEDWLRIYAAHAHAHADQIRRARTTITTPPPPPG